MLMQAGKTGADDERKSVKFNGDACSLTNIRIVSVYGDCQYIVKILIFITHIGNLLINSLYGTTETFASWFEMAFKRCVLGVIFHVTGLALTYGYANVWQTSFTDVYKTMVASISQREVCMQI